MSRYTASEVVQLPRLTAVGAMALGEQLFTAAKSVKKQLPKGIARAHAALGSCHGDLASTLRDQVSPSEEGGESEDAVLCDRVLDNCYSGLLDFLTAFTKLPPGSPQIGEATALQATIFPDKLKFTQLTYVLQWSESELRIQRIRKNGLGARIETLGGKPFLDALARAHEAYGRALGVTVPVEAGAEAAPSVREALDAFSAALRTYVIKVIGAVEPEEPQTQALSDKLLAPLAAWNVGPSARAATRKNGKPDEGAAPPQVTDPKAPSDEPANDD